MPRSWAELLGEEGAPAESEEEQQGFLGRLRDSLGRSRRALTEQLEVAVFDPSDEAAWDTYCLLCLNANEFFYLD